MQQPVAPRAAKVGTHVVKVKFTDGCPRDGQPDETRPPLGPFVSALSSQLMRDARLKADLEREVEQHRRALRDQGDRKAFNAATFSRQEQLALVAERGVAPFG